MRLRHLTFLTLFTLLAFLLATAEPAHSGGDTSPNTLTAQEKAEGWKLLFDGKSLDGWRVYNKKDTKGWIVKDGSIHLEKPGSGDLMTAEKYGDFEFAIDWRFETGNNSGIVYRLAETKGAPWTTGPEMQVMGHDPKDKLGKTSGGSLYDVFAPSSNPFKGKDAWTTYKIVARGQHLEHWVNGTKVVDAEMGSDAWKAAMDKSKWKSYPQFASHDSGHVSLQDHGGKIYFRNVKVRVLEKK